MLLLYAEAIARRSVVGAVGLLVVGGRVDDSEVLVELNIDWTAVAEGDFDFVVAVFVSDFGLGDSALSGLGERSRVACSRSVPVIGELVALVNDVVEAVGVRVEDRGRVPPSYPARL